MSFVSFLRFWTVAASRNSSLAALGPLRRNRPILRMRFKIERLRSGRRKAVTKLSDQLLPCAGLTLLCRNDFTPLTPTCWRH